MPEDYSRLLSNEIKNVFIFFIAMLFTSGIAFFYGFYKLDKKEKINIKISFLFSVFFIYFFTLYVIGWRLLKLFDIFTYRSNTTYLMLDFFLKILLMFFLYLFCFKTQKKLTLQILKDKSHFSNTTDILIGVFSWLIIFPIISFFSSIIDIFILIFYKTNKLPEQHAVDFVKSAIPHPLLLTLLIFIIVIIAPLIEEFLFRGVLYNFLRNYLKRFLAMTLTSIFFAFAHFSLTQKLANISILVSIFILGFFLNFLYERQKSLIAPIFLHATFNALSLLNLIFIKGT